MNSGHSKVEDLVLCDGHSYGSCPQHRRENSLSGRNIRSLPNAVRVEKRIRGCLKTTHFRAYSSKCFLRTGTRRASPASSTLKLYAAHDKSNFDLLCFSTEMNYKLCATIGGDPAKTIPVNNVFNTGSGPHPSHKKGLIPRDLPASVQYRAQTILRSPDEK